MEEPLSPFSCAQPPHLLGGLEIHHLSSLLPGSLEGDCRDCTPAIGSRVFGVQAGICEVNVPKSLKGHFFPHFPKIRNTPTNKNVSPGIFSVLLRSHF